MTVSTKFADTGSTIQVMTFDDERIYNSLPMGVYIVEFDPMAGFYLRKKHRAFQIPQKIYGDTLEKSDKILKAYTDTDKSTGVLFSGDKGSGKTMLASITAQEAMKKFNLPILLLEQALPQAPLVQFLTDIGECVLLIDEFGKKFSNEEGEQGGLLGMFDGIDSRKKLVLLTENRTYDINEFMLNRPGRIRYHFRFSKLAADVTKEYCEDLGVPEEVVDRILVYRDSSLEFSFDTLQAIVQEYKLFGSNIDKLIEDLNIEQPLDSKREYIDVVSIHDMTANVPRELMPSEFPQSNIFPKGGHRIRMSMQSLEGANKGKHKSAISSDGLYEMKERDGDSFVFGSQNLVKHEKGMYVFAVTDDNNHDLLIRAEKRTATHMYF